MKLTTPLRASHVWKLVGLAGAMGVAATGVLVARGERQRRAYSPDEIRSVLHERYTQRTPSSRSKRFWNWNLRPTQCGANRETLSAPQLTSAEAARIPPAAISAT